MASGLVVLAGCAGRPVDPPPAPASAHVAVQPGRPGFVIAAPPGGGDVDSDEIATAIARRTGFGLVVATGLSPARHVDEVYERRVLEAARGPLRLYAEIHGSDHARCAGQIEIATSGIDRELALRLRALAELIRDAHLRAHPEIERLDVLVEPTEARTGGRRDGILRLPGRALHIELPRCARRDFRDAYTAILAEFLAQSVPLAAGR
ncbi:MAG TPA: hypothetical protein VFV05_13760 [Methylomirabilota bacterium]|nr:hypothetical protein [Methylomirabilota bacterium]